MNKTCPNCNATLPDDWQFPRCPFCGAELPSKDEELQPTISMGDANAISGGVHIDSHNTIANIERQKTDTELQQEKIVKYKQLCQQVYADGKVDANEARNLENMRLSLGLDKTTAREIQRQVREMRFQHSISRLNPIAKITITQVLAQAKAGNTEKLIANLPRLEVMANKYDVDDVQFYYYLLLSGVDPLRCIKKYEEREKDVYWLSFWSCMAYLNTDQHGKAEDVLTDIEVFNDYPYGNMTLLAATNCLYQYWDDTSIIDYLDQAKAMFEAGCEEHSDLLDRYTQALMLIIEPNDGYNDDFDDEFSFYFKYIFNKVMEKKTKAYFRKLIPPIPKIAPLPH